MKYQEKISKKIFKYIYFCLIVMYILFFLIYISCINFIDRQHMNESSKELFYNVSSFFDNMFKYINDEKNEMKFIKIIQNKNLDDKKFLIYDFRNEFKIKSNILFYDKYNNLLNFDFNLENEFNFNYLQKIVNLNCKDIILNSYYYDKTSSVFVITKKILNNGIDYGYVCFCMNSKDIKDIFINDNFEFIITDRFDRIISKSDIFRNLDYIEKIDFNKIKSECKNYLINLKKLNEINIYCMVKSEFNQQILYFLIILFMFSAIIAILFVKYIAKEFSIKSTYSFSLLLKEIELNKRKINIKTDDEFEIIADKINYLIDNVEILTKRNIDLKYENQISEYKRMQYQFNPHFLYNSLELIRSLIIVDKNKAIDVIYKISSLLRYCLNEIDKICLEEDLINLNNFLEIQKIKYCDNIEYNINIDEVLYDFLVPKLFLQPFLENSIKYGFNNREKLIIEVFISLNDDYIEFLIVDNGENLSDYRIYELNLMIKNLVNENIINVNHYGIANSIKRLKLIYDNEISYGFRKSKGVEFYIKIKK